MFNNKILHIGRFKENHLPVKSIHDTFDALYHPEPSLGQEVCVATAYLPIVGI